MDRFDKYLVFEETLVPKGFYREYINHKLTKLFKNWQFLAILGELKKKDEYKNENFDEHQFLDILNNNINNDTSDPVILLSGWTSHAVCIVIRKSQSSVSIINAGEGGNNHGGSKKIPDISKQTFCKSIITFDRINSDKIDLFIRFYDIFNNEDEFYTFFNCVLTNNYSFQKIIGDSAHSEKYLPAQLTGDCTVKSVLYSILFLMEMNNEEKLQLLVQMLLDAIRLYGILYVLNVDELSIETVEIAYDRISVLIEKYLHTKFQEMFSTSLVKEIEQKKNQILDKKKSFYFDSSSSTSKPKISTTNFYTLPIRDSLKLKMNLIQLQQNKLKLPENISDFDVFYNTKLSTYLIYLTNLNIIEKTFVSYDVEIFLINLLKHLKDNPKLDDDTLYKFGIFIYKVHFEFSKSFRYNTKNTLLLHFMTILLSRIMLSTVEGTLMRDKRSTHAYGLDDITFLSPLCNMPIQTRDEYELISLIKEELKNNHSTYYKIVVLDPACFKIFAPKDKKYDDKLEELIKNKFIDFIKLRHNKMSTNIVFSQRLIHMASIVFLNETIDLPNQSSIPGSISTFQNDNKYLYLYWFFCISYIKCTTFYKMPYIFITFRNYNDPSVATINFNERDLLICTQKMFYESKILKNIDPISIGEYTIFDFLVDIKTLSFINKEIKELKIGICSFTNLDKFPAEIYSYTLEENYELKNINLAHFEIIVKIVEDNYEIIDDFVNKQMNKTLSEEQLCIFLQQFLYIDQFYPLKEKTKNNIVKIISFNIADRETPITFKDHIPLLIKYRFMNENDKFIKVLEKIQWFDYIHDTSKYESTLGGNPAIGNDLDFTFVIHNYPLAPTNYNIDFWSSWIIYTAVRIKATLIKLRLLDTTPLSNIGINIKSDLVVNANKVFSPGSNKIHYINTPQKTFILEDTVDFKHNKDEIKLRYNIIGDVFSIEYPDILFMLGNKLNYELKKEGNILIYKSKKFEGDTNFTYADTNFEYRISEKTNEHAVYYGSNKIYPLLSNVSGFENFKALHCYENFLFYEPIENIIYNPSKFLKFTINDDNTYTTNTGLKLFKDVFFLDSINYWINNIPECYLHKDNNNNFYIICYLSEKLIINESKFNLNETQDKDWKCLFSYDDNKSRKISLPSNCEIKIPLHFSGLFPITTDENILWYALLCWLNDRYDIIKMIQNLLLISIKNLEEDRKNDFYHLFFYCKYCPYTALLNALFEDKMISGNYFFNSPYLKCEPNNEFNEITNTGYNYTNFMKFKTKFVREFPKYTHLISKDEKILAVAIMVHNKNTKYVLFSLSSTEIEKIKSWDLSIFNETKRKITSSKIENTQLEFNFYSINTEKPYLIQPVLNYDESKDIKELFISLNNITKTILDDCLSEIKLGNAIHSSLLGYFIQNDNEMEKKLLDLILIRYQILIKISELEQQLNLKDTLTYYNGTKSIGKMELFYMIIYGYLAKKSQLDLVEKVFSDITQTTQKGGERFISDFVSPTQADSIERDTVDDTSHLTKIHNLIMGGGKTSMITPLCIIRKLIYNYSMFAEKNQRKLPNTTQNSVFIILPTDHLVDQSLNIFKKYILPFFPIEVQKIEEDRKNMNEKEKKDRYDTIFNHFNRIIVMTDTSLKCCLINYPLLIQRNFKSHSFIFDEADTILNPRTSELNYPLEIKQIPPFVLNKSIDFIYTALKNILEKIIKDPTPNPNISIYYKKSLFQILNLDKSLETNIKAFILESYKSLSSDIDEYLITESNPDLSRIGQQSSYFWCEHYILRQFYQNIVFVLFKMKYNSKDGFGLPNDPLKFKAVPYKAADEPIDDSDFSEPVLVISATILSYIINGLRVTDIENYIKDLTNRVLSQINSIRELTTDYKELLDLSKIFEFNIQDIEMGISFKKRDLLETFRKTGVNLQQYLKLFALFNYQFSNTLLKCSGIELFFSHNFWYRSGFTGTTTNIIDITEPNKISIDDDETELFEKDGILEVRDLTLRQILNETPIVMSKPEDELEFLSHILENYTSPTAPIISTIIDVCGLFAGFSVESFTEKLRNKYDNICYWDIKNHSIPTILNFISGQKSLWDTSLTISDKTLYYYDQSHIIGTDAKIPTPTTGLVFIDSKTAFRELSQGMFRMRKIGKGHEIKIILITNNEEEKKLENCLFTIQNQVQIKESLKKKFYEQNLIGLFKKDILQGKSNLDGIKSKMFKYFKSDEPSSIHYCENEYAILFSKTEFESSDRIDLSRDDLKEDTLTRLYDKIISLRSTTFFDQQQRSISVQIQVQLQLDFNRMNNVRYIPFRFKELLQEDYSEQYGMKISKNINLFNDKRYICVFYEVSVGKAYSTYYLIPLIEAIYLISELKRPKYKYFEYKDTKIIFIDAGNNILYSQPKTLKLDEIKNHLLIAKLYFIGIKSDQITMTLTVEEISDLSFNSSISEFTRELLDKKKTVSDICNRIISFMSFKEKTRDDDIKNSLMFYMTNEEHSIVNKEIKCITLFDSLGYNSPILKNIINTYKKKKIVLLVIHKKRLLLNKTNDFWVNIINHIQKPEIELRFIPCDDIEQTNIIYDTIISVIRIMKGNASVKEYLPDCIFLDSELYSSTNPLKPYLIFTYFNHINYIYVISEKLDDLFKKICQNKSDFRYCSNPSELFKSEEKPLVKAVYASGGFLLKISL